MPSRREDQKHDVFISYSRSDVLVAEALHRALEAAGLTVWRDETRLGMGELATPTISEALRRSTAVAVLWSDHALTSRWVQKEADYAEVAGKYLPLAVDGFDFHSLDEMFRDYVCGSLTGVTADPADFARKARGLAAPDRSTAMQIRHPDIRPVKSFIGREEMLGTLEDLLWKGRGTVAIRNTDDAAVALRGLGGVGKTVLARHFAWENRKRYRGLWWLRAETRDTLLDDLVALGERLRLPLGGLEPEDAARATVDHLAGTQGGLPWLLVYDNVDDKLRVRDLIPPEGAQVLITTRLSDWLGEAEDLPVDVFPRSTAIKYLLDGARFPDSEAAGRLADALGCLPLALAQARAYCRARQMPFCDYQQQLAELLDRLPKEKNPDYPRSVFATFTLAMDRAITECPAAERLMGIIAHFAPDQIPLWLIPETTMPAAERGDAVEALARLSLISHDPLPDGTPAISVHRLVQVVMRKRLEDAGVAANYAAEATSIMFDAFQEYSATTEIWCKRSAWLPNALAVLEFAAAHGEGADKTLWVLNFIGDFRIRRGELSEAKKAYEKCLAIARHMISTAPSDLKWHRNLAVSYRQVASALRTEGSSKALEMLRTSQQILERISVSAPNNLRFQHDLGLVLESIGDVLKANGYLRAALRAYRTKREIGERLVTRNSNWPDWQRELATSYFKISDVYIAGGKLNQAIQEHCAGFNILVKLASSDTSNTDWQNDVAAGHLKLGEILVYSNDLVD